MKWLFSARWTCTRALMSLLILTIFLSGVWGTGIVQADNGNAVFDIQPTFFPHVNARPRPYFIYDSYPAALIQDSLHVTNVGNSRGTVSLYPVDAITAPSSGVAFTAPNDPSHDVGSWIRLSRQQITLDPGQSLDIPFRLSIPDRVRPGQHGGGIIAEDLTQGQTQSSSSHLIHTALQIQSQDILGVLVNLPGMLVEKLSVMRVTYDTQNTYQRVLIRLQNTGTQLLHPSGNLQIINAAGQQIQNLSLQLDTFLPQTTIDYPVYIQRNLLHPGTYTARVHLNYESGHSLNYATTFVVPVPPLQKNTNIPRPVSDLLTFNPDFFSALTLPDYIIGVPVLFLLLSSLFYWGRKLCKFAVNLKQSGKGRRT